MKATGKIKIKIDNNPESSICFQFIYEMKFNIIHEFFMYMFNSGSYF
jgi:hypothetical protein